MSYIFLQAFKGDELTVDDSDAATQGSKKTFFSKLRLPTKKKPHFLRFPRML